MRPYTESRLDSYRIGIPLELLEFRTQPWLSEGCLTCDPCHQKGPIFNCTSTEFYHLCPCFHIMNDMHECYLSRFDLIRFNSNEYISVVNQFIIRILCLFLQNCYVYSAIYLIMTAKVTIMRIHIQNMLSFLYYIENSIVLSFADYKILQFKHKK